MEYQLFKASYTDEAGNRRQSDTWHMRFRDHLNRRQKLATSPRERDAHHAAGKVIELVRCRRTGEHVGDKLRKWLEAQSEKMVKRLVEMEIIDPLATASDMLLADLLQGRADADSRTIEPGYRQSLAASGNTDIHVGKTVDRIKKLLDACAFLFWRDMAAPGAATRVAVYLGELRDKGKINGSTLNHYVGAIKGFCNWLATEGKAPAIALATLQKVENVEADAQLRRELAVDEMRWLVRAAPGGRTVFGLTGSERALLYRFAFETGVRPGQMRSLIVADFDLNADPPTVKAQARFVKRRKTHVQILRPALASHLKGLFATRMPSAPAFKMPSEYNLARMLKHDLAAARSLWLAEPVIDDERLDRLKSDFLSDVSHTGERAVFYSIRHGHGTALADAGVPEKDIAASMHHTNRSTTARYLHSGRKALSSAIDALPDLSYPQAQVATGTDGAEVSVSGEAPLANPWPTGTTSMDSGGQTGLSGSVTQDAVLASDMGNSAKNAESGSVAQRSEQGTHNPLVLGSNPSAPNLRQIYSACSLVSPVRMRTTWAMG